MMPDWFQSRSNPDLFWKEEKKKINKKKKAEKLKFCEIRKKSLDFLSTFFVLIIVQLHFLPLCSLY